MNFYNSSRGSTFITSPAPSVNFSININFATSIRGIKSNNTSNCAVRSAVKWLKEKEEVDSYGSRKSQREAILYDNEDHIPVTVSENLLNKLTEEKIQCVFISNI